MIQLHRGDRVAIVSLSSGILGEAGCAHQLRLGQERLEELGLVPVFMPNALRGVQFLAQHPEARAQDLVQAFGDPSIKGILCAIGGDDTFRLAPFILGSESAIRTIRTNPKFFMGYSDTTVDHLMLYQLGIPSFYGLSFLTDFAELGPAMLPYSKAAFETIFGDAPFVYTPSPLWYEERTDFSALQVGTPRVSHPDPKGWVLLKGSPIFGGHLLGGCLESLADLLSGSRYPEEAAVSLAYGLFPDPAAFQGAILFLETSELRITPDELARDLSLLKDRGVFDGLAGLLVGKPQNEVFYEEYQEVYRRLTPENLPVVYNLNFGHAYPKLLLQYGARAQMDQTRQELVIERR